MNNKNVRYGGNLITRKYNLPMAIIIGINCKNGIVIGSDSQITAEYLPFKKVGYDKIFEHWNDNNTNFYNLAGAGDPDYIFKTNVEVFTRFINRDIKTTLEFGIICEEAVNEICKKYVVDRAKNLGIVKIDESCPPDLRFWQNQFDNLNFNFISGVIINTGNNAKKALYLVDLRGMAKKVDTYCVTGSGFLFAEYVLSRLYKKDIDIYEAINIMIYIIEEVKKHDPNRGGEIKISVIENQIGITPQTLANSMIKKQKELIMELDDRIKEIWQEFILNPAKKFKEITAKSKNNKKDDG